MIKCTGVCSRCGRCKGSAMMSGTNERKTKMLVYPEGFKADAGEGLAAAFDIGTTTVVGMLWDLETGEQIAAAARTNPQNEFGMDVISRITYCGKDAENLPALRSRITDCINEIMEELCAKAERSIYEIIRVAVGGNTTMAHLFAGYPVMSLALAPFTPAYAGTVRMNGGKSLLNLPDDAEVIVIPNIAGHVGGDITAGIIASGVLDMEGLSLFIDIGTNGEIVITDGSESYTCSTAAGPAFEGASIRCGMRAAEGAIEKISIDGGDVRLRTIGEKEACGICGSGLIDAIAQMLDAKLIDKKGRLAAAADAEKRKFDLALSERLIETEEGREFILTEKYDGERIVITQNDIREVQLAKGAMKAGMEIMAAKYGKTVAELDRVIVAGAFGSYIDKASAVRIGLLPDIDPEKIISAGNTAGAGVSMTAVCEKEMKFAEKIPQLVKHIELAEEDDFQMKYMMAMGF